MLQRQTLEGAWRYGLVRIAPEPIVDVAFRIHAAWEHPVPVLDLVREPHRCLVGVAKHTPDPRRARDVDPLFDLPERTQPGLPVERNEEQSAGGDAIKSKRDGAMHLAGMMQHAPRVHDVIHRQAIHELCVQNGTAKYLPASSAGAMAFPELLCASDRVGIEVEGCHLGTETVRS